MESTHTRYTSRHFCFTYHLTEQEEKQLQEQQDGGVVDTIVATMFDGDHKQYRDILWQLERAPTTLRLHIQGAAMGPNSITAKKFRTLFNRPRAHVELCKGTWDQNVAYCTKEDSRVAGPYRWTQRRAGKTFLDHWDKTTGAGSSSSSRESVLAETKNGKDGKGLGRRDGDEKLAPWELQDLITNAILEGFRKLHLKQLAESKPIGQRDSIVLDSEEVMKQLDKMNT
jgi:hypothetical protein